MRAIRSGLVASLLLAISTPLSAQPLDSDASQRTAAAAIMAGVADCTIRQDPLTAAQFVAVYQRPDTAVARTLRQSLLSCMSVNARGLAFSSQTNVMRGLLGMAFVRDPARLPAGVVLSPLPSPPEKDYDIALTVAACVAQHDPAGARRFAEVVPGLPEEQAAFAAIDAAAAQCIAPWPKLSINGALLRANLGIALFRAAVAEATPQH